MQESHFLGLFLVHQEVDGLALIAEFTLRVSDLRTDICQIPYLFCHFGTNGKLWFCRGNSLAELHVKSDGIVRTATETVIPFVVAPRVYYLLHFISFNALIESIIWSIILITPKNHLNQRSKTVQTECIKLAFCRGAACFRKIFLQNYE